MEEMEEIDGRNAWNVEPVVTKLRSASEICFKLFIYKCLGQSKSKSSKLDFINVPSNTYICLSIYYTNYTLGVTRKSCV